MLQLTSVTLVRDRTLRMHARVALWSTRPRASIDDRRLVALLFAYSPRVVGLIKELSISNLWYYKLG